MSELQHMIKGGTRKIREIGGSSNISLPKPFLKTVGLKPGDDVEVMYNNIMLVIIPIAKEKVSSKI